MDGIKGLCAPTLVLALAVAWSVGGCGAPAIGARDGDAPVVAEVEPSSAGEVRAPARAAVIASEGERMAFPGGHAHAKVPVFEDDPVWGSALAPVTLVIFSDFQCPYCAKVAPTLDALRQKYGPDVLRLVWKDFPLPFHRDAPLAHDAARAVYQLAGDEGFWRFHDLLFDNQRAWSAPSMAEWAAKSGASPSHFGRLVEAPATAERVERNVASGKSVGVRGTPAFFINGQFLSGARPLAAFAELIDAEIAATRQLARRGVPPERIYVERAGENFASAPKPSPPPAADTTTVWRVPVHQDDPFRGNPKALVTIIEFAEFQCPFCSRVQPTLNQLLADYGSDLRVVWKDNPLPFHQRAKPAATVAREVYAQKGNAGFWAIHHILFANQAALEDPELLDYGQRVGANVVRLKSALAHDRHATLIARGQEEAGDFNAGGTPHFFINGRRVSGAQPEETFKAIIDEEIVRAKALLATGTPRHKLYDALVANGKGPQPPEKLVVGAPPADAPSRGPKNAKVVVQLFSDFQCPFCKRVNDTLTEVMKKHGREVRLVYRHKPLPFHKDAPLAHEAAVEAYVQKGDAGFWAMYDKLFENQTDLTQPALERYGAEIGLDVAKLAASLDTRRHRARVTADVDASDQAGIRGTPGFVINDYFLSGAQPESEFSKLIRLALAEAP